MSKNSVFCNRTKHINLKHYYIRETVENEEILIKHVKIRDQFMDIFTKALPYDKFVYPRELLDMANKKNKEECCKLVINVFHIMFILS